MYFGKNSLGKIILSLILLVFTISIGFSSTQTILVEVNETIKDLGVYNSQFGWNVDKTLSGEIIVSNINPTETVSDIYINFDNASNILGVSYLMGMQGEVLNFGGNQFTLHIPQLQPNNVSIFNYSIDSNINNPLNFSTLYSVGKVLSGEEFNVEDNLENVFDNASYQANTCIYDIQLIQSLMVAGNSSFDSFTFLPATIQGTDSGNVVYGGLNKIQTWDVQSGACLNKGSSIDINYNLTAPLDVDNNLEFNLSNTTLSYKLNETISQLRLKSILAVGDANLTLSKQILKPSHPTLHGTNVTWQVNGSFETDSSLDYILEKSTFWVSQRNVDGLYTNMSKIDVDGIDGASLIFNFTPNVIVNSSQFWQSTNWLFNYSDVPSPITWMNVSFNLANDGIQLKNRSFTKSENSLYYKEIVVISGYLLEISKNVTSIGVDKYNIKITVSNRGPQITPVDSIVTVYDFIPENFILSSPITYSNSAWYSTSKTNDSITGDLTGELIQWGLIPTNGQNASLNDGLSPITENTWTAEYNISGQGDYQNLDVFITGLDPQAVDGAGAAKAILIEDNFLEFGLFETLSALVSGVLVFVIFLL